MSDAIDVFHVKGADGVIRSLDEHYDCQKAVEQDPHGAWLAIQNQAYRIKELEAERDHYAEKLMQSNNTYTEMHLAMGELETENARLWDALYRIQDRSYGKNAAIARNALKELKGENQ